MITFMAEKQVYSTSIIIQISFEKVILLQALYTYTAIPNMVIRVTAMDTHGSWHISLASSFWGISKADIASVMGVLCSVIAVTSV